jgi:hypothetical protein
MEDRLSPAKASGPAGVGRDRQHDGSSMGCQLCGCAGRRDAPTR